MTAARPDPRVPAAPPVESRLHPADPDPRWKVQCLNCGAALDAPFCGECGQRALPPHPTIRELAGDALSELSGWDGKLAETIRTLVRVPGELTRQWVEGRRAHFISPMRLYLTASLAYFVIAAAAPNTGKSFSRVSVGGVDIVGGRAAKSRPERVGDAAGAALSTGKGLTGSARDSAIADIAKSPWMMRPMLLKAVDDPQAIPKGMLKWLPRILFALLPIYAGFLMLFYRRRHYPEHLFFAIHLHAFVFVALSLSDIAKFTRSAPVAGGARVVAAVWIAVYSLLALRRVYGGTIGRNLVKAIGIMMLYSLIALPALMLAVFLSAF